MLSGRDWREGTAARRRWQPEPRPGLGKFISRGAGAALSRLAGADRPSDDPLYLADAHLVKFGDLRRRHPVAGQRAHSTHLGRRYGAGRAPGHRFSLYWFWSGGPFDWRAAQRPRRHREDARLTPRLRFGWCRSIRCRSRHVRPGRLEQVFSGLASPGDFLTTVSIVRRLPFGHRVLLQRKSLIYNRI
jgi:hypothetical protein